MNEIIHLTSDFEQFENNVNSLIQESKEFIQLKIENEEQLTDLKIKTKNWSDKVMSFLKSSFSNEMNEYVLEFRNANTNSYSFNSSTTLKLNIDKQIELVNVKQQTLLHFIKLLPVLDAVVNSENIELKIRESYTVDEKLELLMEKLYKLNCDGFYSVLQILRGNGINSNRSHEDRELAQILEANNLLEIYPGMGVGIMVQLTLEGIRYVENNKKPVKENYNKIPNSTEEIAKKIDEIIEKLKTLGYGQEIIFNEFEELKEHYTKMNKKTWGQVLKGKLVDLSLAKLVENDTLKYIYEDLTDSKLAIPSISKILHG